jgi:outer membrane protein assembly factor BamB
VATNVPAAWDGAAGTGIRWKTKVPRPGWSSPVVWGNRVFLTGADKDHQELYAFDADSGALLWTADTAGLPGAPAQPVEVSGDAGYAAPTPATDGRFVAAVFANGALLCADVQGKRVWGKHLGAPANHYGHSSSLLVHDGRLLVQMDDSERPRLLAFRVANGEALWETKGSAISWASPIVIETDGQTQIVAADSEGVSGYNPADGVRLWRVDCLGGELGPSPASGAGLVFVANLYATAAGIRPGETPEIAWKWDENLPDTASPLFANNLLFLATSSGTLVCLDALQGTVQWEHEFGTGFYASPILANDRVYALDREGVMHILEAAPEFKLVAECPLGEKADATPAFVNGRLYLRGAEHLYCVEGRE